MIGPYCMRRLWITVALFCSSRIAVGASSAPTELVGTVTTSQSLSSGHNAGNPVIQLGKYVVDSLVRAKDGTVQLYTNHRRCNEIRDKQRQYRIHATKNTPGGTATPLLKQNLGITYDEFIFLQRGKEDRGKLANIIFMMVFAPNFVPYAFMFFPDMLPSPFAQKTTETQHAQNTRIPITPIGMTIDDNNSLVYKYQDALSRQRTHVVLSTLLELERNAHTPSFFANLNPFGKAKVKKHMDDLDQSNDQLALFLTRGLAPTTSPTTTVTPTPTTPHREIIKKHSWKLSSAPSSKQQSTITSSKTTAYHKDVGPYAVMKTLHQYFYRKDTPHSKNEAQLVSLPRSILSGLDQLLTLSFSTTTHSSHNVPTNTNSLLASFLPKFIVRGKVLNYIKQIEEADEFLVDSRTCLDTLSMDVLQATCQKRLMGGPYRTEQELRESLSTWLDCTVVIPRKRCKKSSSLVASTTVAHHATEGKRASLYFNGNLARAALLCYNALEGARDSRNASYLPRLLFSGLQQH